MQICFHNKYESKIDFTNELLCFHPNILIAEIAKLDSVSGNEILSYHATDEFSDDEILLLAEVIHNRNLKTGDKPFPYERYSKRLKELSNEKRKSKEHLVLLGKYKKLVQQSKVMIKLIDEAVLKNKNLFDLLPFVQENILKPKMVNFAEEDELENLYIKDMIEDINNKDNIFCLDYGIEKLFSFNSLITENEILCDFIKIPLWNFPSFKEITYDKMKYTRDELLPILSSFKLQLIELIGKLNEISFVDENMNLVNQLCIENINHHISPIQTKIDESLYLMQQKSKYPDLPHVKFCLGIASTHLLIDYYEKNEVLIPYVASEIKQQLSRQIDLNRACVFCYYEIHNPSDLQS